MTGFGAIGSATGRSGGVALPHHYRQPQPLERGRRLCPFPAIITEPSNGDIGWIPDLMNELCDYPRISGFKGVACNVHTHRDKPIATTLGTSARATST